MYHRLRCSVFKRFVRSNSSNSIFQKEQFLVQSLPSRSILKINGSTVSDYLQGLITNDINHLKDGTRSMFTMFLNSKGRVLYDSIIYRLGEESFYIEADYKALNDLKKHLNMFKVRRKINVESLDNDFNVWNVNYLRNVENVRDHKFQNNGYKQFSLDALNSLENSVATCDPRVSEMGWRVIAPKECNLQTLLQQSGINAVEEFYYTSLRHTLGIGEGIDEIPPGNSFPLESNCDYLHGISFHKGCYIGQELTARTYHTGVVRKRIMPLAFEEDVSSLLFDTPITSGTEQKSLGKVRGVREKNGVGLLRVEEVLKADSLLCNGKSVKTHRPIWWPTEAPKERRNVG